MRLRRRVRGYGRRGRLEPGQDDLACATEPWFNCRVGRPAIVFTLASAAVACAVLLGVPPVGSPVAVASRASSCGPANAKTLVAGRQSRVFVHIPDGLDIPFAWACLNSGEFRPRALGPIGTRWGVQEPVRPNSIRLNAPWVAYPWSIALVPSLTSYPSERLISERDQKGYAVLAIQGDPPMLSPNSG
jgi:hypothetical protein